jgi:ClpP class serine protease
MTSYEGLKYQLATAARDASVSSILLDMDSPGGEAVGSFEAADAVRAAAGVKEVVAVVSGMAASAAYAIASAATRIVTTSSGISGSIGVVMLHADYSNKLH